MGLGVTILLIAAGVSFFMGFKFLGIAATVLLVRKIFKK